MFIDQVKITVESGSGGHGCISFRREKYVPNGGPDGGDGGNGGNIVFVADSSIATLVDFRYKSGYKAQKGTNGTGSKCKGKKGEDLVLKVPLGTLIRYKHETDEIGRPSGAVIADMNNPGEPVIIAKGGRGGRGNQHFATPSRQAPKFCEDGKPGRKVEIILELKLIADVGIIGLPNAGKSTLLSIITNATPKIANYQFTTLSPNLGIVKHGYNKDFVLADIPGLIEGASKGVGLGFDFLRHIERTRILVHVVDVSDIPGNLPPVEAIEIIDNELRTFNSALVERPRIIAANKIDLPFDQEQVDALKALASKNNWPIVMLSGATTEGSTELVAQMVECLAAAPEIPAFETDFDTLQLSDQTEEFISVNKVKEGVFSVEGPGIERLLGYTNMADEKGFRFFQRFMREKGIIERLEELGIEENDTVQIYELEFDFLK